MKTKQILKSRTINLNALVMALIPFLPQLGITLTVEQATAILGILNIILRFMTDRAIHEK